MLTLSGFNIADRPISVTVDSVTVDGVTVALNPYEQACALADSLRRVFFVGRVWELDPTRPGYHRDTDKHIISDSREVMKQFCGSWHGVSINNQPIGEK